MWFPTHWISEFKLHRFIRSCIEAIEGNIGMWGLLLVLRWVKATGLRHSCISYWLLISCYYILIRIDIVRIQNIHWSIRVLVDIWYGRRCIRSLICLSLISGSIDRITQVWSGRIWISQNLTFLRSRLNILQYFIHILWWWEAQRATSMFLIRGSLVGAPHMVASDLFYGQAISV